jgi:flagellar basal body-associated protein FliL
MADKAESPKEIEHKPEGKAPSSKKKVLLIAGISLLTLGVGAPVGYFLLKPAEVPVEQSHVEEVTSQPEAETTEKKEEGAHEELALLEGEEAMGAIVPFDTFLVNLSGGKYLRLQLQAEMETPDIPKRLYYRIVPIRDGIITMLTEKAVVDIESAQGKEDLKKAIKVFINEQLKRQDVRRIYFTQFVIQ